jgi:ubiquinone/menaquinone biosynthesis C-methylase UbiE
MDRLLELTSRAEVSHFWFRGFRNFVVPTLARAAGGRTDLTLLDCGCGTGYNLTLLAPYGRSYGTDLNITGLRMARRVGQPLVRADATTLPFHAEQFDIVTSFDMLQSVPDDGAAVRELARVLKAGGSLVLTVAAFEILHGDHSLLAEDVRRYSRAAVLALLADAGLQPQRVTYAFATLFPIVLAVRLAQRLWRGHSAATGQEIAVPPPLVNELLAAVVSGEAALARFVSMPFGSSLVVLARKP